VAADFEEQILERYRDELVWLRRMGSRFAKRYPRVAKRLELSDGPSPDPHVERLLEGVAFLTARLQHNLEAELPDITAGLLAALYPHFFQPIPSLAIAQLMPDDGGAGMTTGMPLPRHLQLYCETSFERRTCRWRTAYPMTLWPIVVQEAVWESPAKYAFMGPTSRVFSDVRSVLRLRLHSNTEPFHNLKPAKLRFFLDGEPRVTGALYELLTTGLHSVVSFDPNRVPGRNDTPDRGTIDPVGFALDETVLPTASHGLRGYALLQEYFALPEKFLFVDVRGLKSHFVEQDLDVLICFNSAPRRKINVTSSTPSSSAARPSSTSSKRSANPSTSKATPTSTCSTPTPAGNAPPRCIRSSR
jgi:type VI secretion system protein ImpG